MHPAVGATTVAGAGRHTPCHHHLSLVACVLVTSSCFVMGNFNWMFVVPAVAPCSVYCVKMSMMEIYCEMLNDLLDSSKLNLDVQVRSRVDVVH